MARAVPGFVARPRGSRLRVPAMVALFAGARLGEVLALRWSRVDLDRKVIEIREALEATTAHGIRFKPPKSKAGRRDIILPDVLVDVLREHRRPRSSSACSLAPASYRTMRCYSRTLKVNRSSRATC